MQQTMKRLRSVARFSWNSRSAARFVLEFVFGGQLFLEFGDAIPLRADILPLLFQSHQDTAQFRVRLGRKILRDLINVSSLRRFLVLDSWLEIRPFSIIPRLLLSDCSSRPLRRGQLALLQDQPLETLPLVFQIQPFLLK